ncbi:diguanylate cyclase/phosphodiesterase (GGDEF & EAL domains) with PAS/PAC sensor(s) [hydrothermal vent metagenome]|uniref:Diguanylate cyclase/phosphodiesterase (GGDEF & EAL domains) with PAS/PAC sensor(S) n=1 Tax=hydrothermal vent metagenome TaxID=652676 RepID=A0A1W1CDC7_9ZZZZ
MLMHPIKEKLTGKIFLNTPKVPFVQLAVDELQSTGEDKGYIQYSFYSPSAKEYLHKASIVRVFKPFNWIIGTGAYIDNVSTEMKAKAIAAIKEMRYGQNGYFWINNMRHRMIMHPIKPEFDGKVFIDSPKVPFVELGLSQLKKSQKSSDFISYQFYMPLTEVYTHKLSLVSHFKAWDWVIGTGTYTDYIEKNINMLKKNTEKQIQVIVTEIILLTVVIFLLLILFSIYLINRNIVEPLEKFRSSLHSFFQYLVDPSQKIKPLNINSSDEFGEMSTDINKNIERSIQTQRELSMMIQTIHETVTLTQTDKHGIITDVSQSFCDLSGFKKEELIGEPHYIVRHPEMPRSFFTGMWKVLKEKKIWKGDIKNIRKDGSFYWVETIISVKLTKENEIYGYIAIRHDITKRKILEDKVLKQNNINLQKKPKLNV